MTQSSWPPVEIDHHGEDFARDQAHFYRRARAQCPVAQSSAYGGFYFISRYSDIRNVLRDANNYSSARFATETGALGGGVAIPPNGVRIGIIEMDAPQATQLRDLLKPWFSIAAVNAGSARIAEISEWVLDFVIARGACDVVSDMANPMPSLLILDILGLPLDRWRAYGKVLHEAVAKAGGSLAGLRWLLLDLRQLVEAKGYHADGLVAALVRAEVDGAALSGDMVCELILMLLFGGADTTIAAISHAIAHFGAHPEDRQRLVEDRTLIPAAVEEILRLHSPSTGVARTVMREAKIAGVALRPGDRILCAVNSGNRDEAMFADAEYFNMDRPAKPHLAFGAGIHACLGQNLARADLCAFLTDIFERMPDFEIDFARAAPYRRTPLVSGYSAMPVRFKPRAPKGRVGEEFPTLRAPRIAPTSA